MKARRSAITSFGVEQFDQCRLSNLASLLIGTNRNLPGCIVCDQYNIVRISIHCAGPAPPCKASYRQIHSPLGTPPPGTQQCRRALPRSTTPTPPPHSVWSLLPVRHPHWLKTEI